MQFAFEGAKRLGKRTAALISFMTTLVSLVAIVLTEDFWPVVAIILLGLCVAILDLAHVYWKERNEIEEQLHQEIATHESTPEFKIDTLLRETWALRLVLKYPEDGFDPQQQHLAVLRLFFDSNEVIARHAPAFRGDLKMKPPDDPAQDLRAVEECYEVLSEVRKQL